VTLFKRLFAPVAALLALASGSVAEAKALHSGSPALWAVSDADTTIYLFGTIHVLPENYQWRTAKFNEAVAASQQLMLETIVDQKNPQQLMATFAGMGFGRGLPPLVQRVPADKRAALGTAMQRCGLTGPYMDQMKTWAAAFMLLNCQFKDMGVTGAEGVENILRQNFAGSGKLVGELESNAEQLSFFDKLGEQDQRALLEGSIEQPVNMSQEFDAMLKSWAKGDVDAISRTFDQELTGSPGLKDALIKRRNANWSKWIEQRMAEPGAVMIAVGAGHLAGPDSVISLLKKDGYRITRVQ
jgi:uncharacterized protein YbaP (TraB family)